MNPLQEAIKSLLKVILVSICIGFCGYIITKSVASAISIFVITSIIQFVIGYYSNTRLIKNSQQIDSIINDAIRLVQEQRLPYELGCAYCNTKNRVPISFLQDNIFKCANCNQANKVYIQFTTVRLTQPLEAKIESTEISIDDSVSENTINNPVEITK